MDILREEKKENDRGSYTAHVGSRLVHISSPKPSTAADEAGERKVQTVSRLSIRVERGCRRQELAL